MNPVGIQQAARALPELVQQTIENCEETVIVSDNGAVVMINQREWERIMETNRLLRDKTSLKALLDGHKARDEGNIPNGVSMNEAFYDLQSEYPEKCE